jgi:hypothetical protein
MAAKTRPGTASAMIQALNAEGPQLEHADKLMLFGRLVGSWDIETAFFGEDGNVSRRGTGEWHFGWVLEGRAIQDVIIAPPRQGRKPNEPSAAYHTEILVYDPKTDTWHVTVLAPIYGTLLNLIARARSDEIWIEGPGPEGNPVRWIFSEFSDDRVRWQGYVSNNDGATWVRTEEIILNRRT